MTGWSISQSPQTAGVLTRASCLKAFNSALPSSARDWVDGRTVIVIDPFDITEPNFSRAEQFLAPGTSRERLKTAVFGRAQTPLHDSEYILHRLLIPARVLRSCWRETPPVEETGTNLPGVLKQMSHLVFDKTEDAARATHLASTFTSQTTGPFISRTRSNVSTKILLILDHRRG